MLKGEVTFEVAKAAASNPNDFELKMTMFSQHADDGGRASSGAAARAAEVEKPADGGSLLEGMTSGMDFVPQP